MERDRKGRDRIHAMYPVGGLFRILRFLRLGGLKADQADRADPINAAIRGNVFFLGLTSLFTDISSEMVISVIPVYLITILRLSPAQFGLIDGLYQGIASIVQLASGLLTDRWRRYKEVAAAGYGLSAACRIGLLTTATGPGIAWVLILDRLGKGLRTAPRDALISLSVSQQQLGVAFGIHRAMDAMGAMLGPILAFALLALIPGAFDVVFMTSFCVALVGLAVLVFFVKNHSATAQDGEASVDLASAVGLLRHRTFRRLFLSTLALSLMTISDAFVYLALQREFNLSSGAFPLLYVVTSLSYLVLAMPAGRLADRWGRLEVFASGYGLLLFLYSLLLWAPPGPILLVMVLLTLGAHYASTEGVLMALGGGLLPEALRSSGLAILSTATALARLAASTLFGILWTQLGLGPAIGVFLIGLIAALAMTLTMLRRARRNA
jgi:MFS family permease